MLAQFWLFDFVEKKEMRGRKVHPEVSIGAFS